jgi:hypothetical protein
MNLKINYVNFFIKYVCSIIIIIIFFNYYYYNYLLVSGIAELHKNNITHRFIHILLN